MVFLTTARAHHSLNFGDIAVVIPRAARNLLFGPPIPVAKEEFRLSKSYWGRTQPAGRLPSPEGLMTPRN